MTTQHTNRTPSDTETDRIRDVERRRLRALVDGDVEAARQLHADDFQLITPIGESLSKDKYLGAIATGHIKYLIWEPEEIEVRIYDNAAVIRYQAQLGVIFGGHIVPPSRYWHTDVYEKHEGSWQATWSQATAIK
jgi:hypothetical protein